MKLQEIEKISAYIDGEYSHPEQIASLIESEIEYKKVYTNFKVVSNLIQSEFDSEKILHSAEKQLEEIWTQVDRKIEEQDKNLSGLLKQTLGQLPEELENLDIWQQVDKKLNDLTSGEKVSKQSNSVPALEGVSALSKEVSNWEALLSESFKLPKKFEETDLWASLSKKLDSQYHPEIFTTDSAFIGLSDKEKYVIGLSEYLDGEVSAAKAQMVNDHLLECSDCRKNYVSFSKLKQALKYSFHVESQIDIWKNLEVVLFPQSSEDGGLSVKKVEGF